MPYLHRCNWKSYEQDRNVLISDAPSSKQGKSVTRDLTEETAVQQRPKEQREQMFKPAGKSIQGAGCENQSH